MLDLVKESQASRIIPIDMRDPSLVFYSPLWYPTSQAIGGVIESGTGTMAATPLTLVVGANTVTATGAGTFFVTMPEGGTVASDGAIVTGSPVTIPASIRTSVTLEGTGTFTCTVSNIFRSMDSNNHAMTVTGALWTPRGRDFNGIDDLITIPDHPSLDMDGGKSFTMESWVKLPLGATERMIVSKSPLFETGNYQYRVNGARKLQWFHSDLTPSSGSGTINIDDDNYHAVVMVYNFTTGQIILYLDGNIEGTTNVTGSIGANTGDLIIGVRDTEWFEGLIGEVRIYNRALNPLEIQRNYLATKWRYR